LSPNKPIESAICFIRAFDVEAASPAAISCFPTTAAAAPAAANPTAAILPKVAYLSAEFA
jgi:hypothetical protein